MVEKRMQLAVAEAFERLVIFGVLSDASRTT